jgi:hypothetical protein
MSCNAKKVRCSYMGTKPSAEFILSSDEEVVIPRPKKAKTSGLVLRAGKVSVEVRKSADGPAKILDAIWQQNTLLCELLIFQEQTALATSVLAQSAWPMTNYLGRIAHTLEARNEGEGEGEGALGSGSGKKKGEGKEKGQGENAANRSGNRDGDKDRNGDKDGDRDEDEDGNGEEDEDETMGRSM